MAKENKKYEGLENLRKDCDTLMEDIEDVTASIKEGVEKLKPYYWYFSLIHSNYFKTHPDVVAEYEDMKLGLSKGIYSVLTHEQNLMHIFMYIKTMDQILVNLDATCDSSNKNASTLYDSIQREDVDFKELNSIYRMIEDIFKLLEMVELRLGQNSENYINAIKRFQSDYPDDYILYTKENKEPEI